MSKAWNRLGAVLALGVLSTGCATSSRDKPLPTYSEEHTERATAVVKALDHTTRHVRLETEEGETFQFVAGPQVRNLGQVQVGDRVVVEYKESIALEVRRADGTAPTVATASDASGAAPGEKPAAGVEDQVTVSAVIVAIDRESLRVTLKGPAGNLRLVQARDPKNLEHVRIGDMVYVTFTEALAISVEKVP